MVLSNPRHSFRTRLGLAIASTILLSFLILSWFIGYISEAQTNNDSGKFLEQLAYQMAISLDQRMYTYFQEIQMLATLDVYRDIEQSLAKKRDLLNSLQHTYNDFAWIGLTNSAGMIIASTDKILEGETVSNRPWFINAQQHPTVQDVHGAKLLAKLLPNPNNNGEPLRFVDVAAPVFNSNSKLIGVLGGHLYWQWVVNVRDDLLQPLENYYQVEVLILSATGEVLLAPQLDKNNHTSSHFSSPTLKLHGLNSFQLAKQGENGFVAEAWLDQQSYLTGYAKTNGHRNYPGLGWVVLVRQPTRIAFATARTLQRQILLWGTIVGVVSGALSWWIAGYLIKPILQIAASTELIRRGDSNVQLPVFVGVDEVARLSQAVSRLFLSLNQQNRLLVAFNEELDQRVKTRTAELYQLNQQLESEVEERKQAAIALEQANHALQKLTLLDGLTGVANRRCFDECLLKEWLRLVREQLPLSLILIDVDYFKRYNDHYGHQAGDRCLQQIAQALSSSVHRSSDVVARYGGEEFAVILPNTEVLGAIHIAETIRQAIKQLQIAHTASDISLYVTLSLGIATIIPLPEANPSLLVKVADQQLYLAKLQGRDRVVAAKSGDF
jgi:diguanylate cyclase (GGDEF)-like protein